MQYRRRDSLSRLYDLNTRFIDRLAKEMEESGRYPDDAILKGRGYVLIEEDAFRDYLKNREALKQGFMPTPYRRETPEEEVFVIGGAQCL